MEPIAETVQNTGPGVIVDTDNSLPPFTAEAAGERRRDPRYATDRLTLLYLTGRTQPEPILCRILDYSRSGLKIRTQRPLDPGTEIRLTLRELFAVGKVRYCMPAVGGFDHGIQVEEIRSTAAVNP